VSELAEVEKDARRRDLAESVAGQIKPN
jgi:hypothetical protein